MNFEARLRFEAKRIDFRDELRARVQVSRYFSQQIRADERLFETSDVSISKFSRRFSKILGA